MKLNFNPKINFKSIVDEYNYKNFENSESKTIYCTTRLFRNDIKWGRLVDFLDSFYKDCSNVNTVDLSCSDGSEVYSMVMLLDKKSDSEKFYPIKAYDLNSELIFQANKGRISLSCDDIIACKRLGISFDDYFTKICDIGNEYELYRTSSNLQDKIEFQPKEATRVLGQMPAKSENTLLLFRNTLPYLTKENREKCYSLIDEKLGKNSIVVVGEFDKHMLKTEVEEKLSERGFKKHPEIEGVFIRN